MMVFLFRAVLFALSFKWNLQKVFAGNTICTSNHTNWYTSVIGETPCTTYQRLRQICNVNYQVGTLTRNTPPDHCSDQVQDCCCNSISFALSMLCLACQDNTSDGFDAGVGAYQQYLLKDSENTCSGRKDRNFTTAIQNAVCNTSIKIEDQLYNLFWDNGEWFYAFTRDSIIRDHAAFSNKTQTKCSVTTTSALPSGTSGKSTPEAASPDGSGSGGKDGDGVASNSKLGPGVIAGIAVGVIVIVGLLVAVVILLRRRRHHHARTVTGRLEIDPYSPHGTRAANPGYSPLGATTTGHFSDGETTTASATTAGPVSYPDWEQHQRNQQSSLSKVNASTSSSSFGYIPQGSNAVDLGREPSANHHPRPIKRHKDAGPLLGTDLDRSDSGRLPPAYGEQLSLVAPGTQVTESKPQVHLSYSPPEARFS